MRCIFRGITTTGSAILSKASCRRRSHENFSSDCAWYPPLPWRNFLIVCVCLAISATYELVEWSTAIVIAYDDSDGWYDHAMDPVVKQSDVTDDNLTGPGACGVTPGGATPGRCGYGPRLPCW